MTAEPDGPRVTVVIPVWDAYVGANLFEAVASARDQAAAVNVLVIDNASDVPVPPLGAVECLRLAQRCSTGAARNAALDHVRTPFVIFLDADDLLLAGAAEALVEGLGAAADCSVHVMSILDGVTGRRHRSPRLLARALARRPRAFGLANTIWSLLPTQGCTIMRVDDVRACGGYADADHGEDWVLGTSLAFRGAVSFDPRPGLLYRRRADSQLSVGLTGPVLLENARRVRARIREDNGIPAGVRRALPVIAAAQWLAARVAHPCYRSLRTRLTRGLPPRG